MHLGGVCIVLYYKLLSLGCHVIEEVLILWGYYLSKSIFTLATLLLEEFLVPISSMKIILGHIKEWPTHYNIDIRNSLDHSTSLAG